jgi:folate-binding protein YgfZ
MEPSEHENGLRALREAAVIVELGHWEAMIATGADRISFLQRMTTGSVQALGPGQGGHSLFLDNKGRVLSELRIFVRAQDLLVLVPAGLVASTAAGLNRYAVMDDFAAAPHPDFVLFGVHGPQAGTALASCGLSIPAEFVQAPAWSHVGVTGPAGPLWLVRGQIFGGVGIWVGGPRAALGPLVQSLESAIPRLAPDIAEALRIEAGEPRFASEVLPGSFPVEVGLGSAIDHSKGCYLGQETIVRMRDRGLVRRRLVGLRLVGDGLPAPGDDVGADAGTGKITSVGRLPGQTAVALALLSTSVPVDSRVLIRGGESGLPAQVAFESPPWT